MSERNHYLVNTGYILLANFLVMVIGFFSRTITARLLGPEQYGIYALILSTASVLPVFLLFSLNVSILYFAARNPDPRRIRELASAAIAFIVLASAAFVLPLYWAAPYLLKDVSMEVIFSAYLLAIASCLTYVAQALQQGAQRFKQFSAFNAVASIAAGGLAITLAYTTQDAVLIGASRAAVLGITALAAIQALGGIGRPSAALLRDMLQYAKFIGLTSILTIPINTIDRYFLLWFRSTAEVGYYDIASVLGTVVLPFVSSLLITMSPKIIQDGHRTKAYYDRIFCATTLVLTVLGIGTFYLSDFAITFILGATYAASVLPLKITALALPAMAVYSINTATLTALSRTRATGTLNILLAVALVAANWAFTPSLGPTGSAIANLAAFVLVAAAGTAYLSRIQPIQIRQPAINAIIFAGAIAAYYVVQGYGFPAKAATVALLMTALAWLNRPQIQEIITSIRHALTRRGLPHVR